MAITKEIIVKAFQGMNTFRWKNESGPLTANMDWDLQIPILRDSFSLQSEDPTFNRSYIHGSKKPIASTTEDGAIPVQFDIPSIDEDTQLFAANLAPAAAASMTDTINGVAGSWVPIGKGLKMGDSKVISGMCMILSEDKKHAIVIKNLEGYARPIIDNISTTPIAFRVNLDLIGIADASDTDGDILFYEFKAS